MLSSNKVDIFCDGIYPYTVTERGVVGSAVLSNNSADPLFTGNFVRVGSAGSPTAGNRFSRLGKVPIVSFPSTITIGTTQYAYTIKATDSIDTVIAALVAEINAGSGDPNVIALEDDADSSVALTARLPGPPGTTACWCRVGPRD